MMYAESIKINRHDIEPILCRIKLDFRHFALEGEPKLGFGDLPAIMEPMLPS